MNDAVSQARLISRIEREALAYRNADSTMRHSRWGRVLGLLEAGAVVGFWSRSVSGRVSDAVEHGMPARRIGRMLLR